METTQVARPLGEIGDMVQFPCKGKGKHPISTHANTLINGRKKGRGGWMEKGRGTESSLNEVDTRLAAQVQQLLLPKSPPVCDWSCIAVKNTMARVLGAIFTIFSPHPTAANWS